ncbi:MAG: ORF6N domain-containing protein [Flavobacteriales bacterium]|nr:ORF6N domain-containing protein [Flavobacteriales bacterium]
MSKALQAYSDEFVMSRIHVIRGQKVMLDQDLAQLYAVETKVLKQQVKRNIDSFPEDFMFELTAGEFESLRSQIVTSNKGGTRYAPLAFTEHGVLMLSSVLKNPRAREVNIQIMRLFVKMRELLLTHKDLLLELEKLRNTSKAHGGKIAVIFKYLKQMEQRQQETELLEEIRRKPRPVVGFKTGRKKGRK